MENIRVNIIGLQRFLTVIILTTDQLMEFY